MEYLSLFIVAAITAMVAENAILSRALGVSKPMLFLKSPRMGILYGGLLTWVVVLSSLLAVVVNVLLEGNAYIPFVRAPLYYISVGIVFSGTYWLTKRYLPALHITIRSALPISTFNSALFGALYVSANQNFGFFETVGYALGTGVGYTAALLIIYFARKRLAVSPVPRSFRGLPVLLVYLGLLSLAIYGLIGHGLAV